MTNKLRQTLITHYHSYLLTFSIHNEESSIFLFESKLLTGVVLEESIWGGGNQKNPFHPFLPLSFPLSSLLVPFPLTPLDVGPLIAVRGHGQHIRSSSRFGLIWLALGRVTSRSCSILSRQLVCVSVWASVPLRLSTDQVAYLGM